MALLARGERVSGRNGALGRPFLSFSFSLLSCLDGLSFSLASHRVGRHCWLRGGVLRRSFIACMVEVSFVVVFYYTHAPFWGRCEIFLEVASRGCEIDGVEVVG